MPLLGTNVIFIFCILLYKMKWNKTSLQQFGAETEQEQYNTKVKENSRQLNFFRWRTSPPNRSLFYFNIQMSCGRISFCLPFFVHGIQNMNPKHHKADGWQVGTDVAPDEANDSLMKIEKRPPCGWWKNSWAVLLVSVQATQVLIDAHFYCCISWNLLFGSLENDVIWIFKLFFFAVQSWSLIILHYCLLLFLMLQPDWQNFC